MNETVMVLLTICCISLFAFGVTSCTKESFNTNYDNTVYDCRSSCNKIVTPENQRLYCFEMCLDKMTNKGEQWHN